MAERECPLCHEHEDQGWFDAVPMVWKPDLARPEPEMVEKRRGFSLSGKPRTCCSIKQQPAIREEGATVMDIADKGH